MMKNAMPALLSLGLLAGGAASAQAQAQGGGGTYTLGRVTFQGNQKLSTDELMAALPYQPGQSITQAGFGEESQAVANAYTKHNVGVNISPRATITNRTRMNIFYTIQEQAPVVQQVGNTADTVQVQGNKRVPSAAILAAGKIQPGGPVTTAMLQQAQTAIVALYKAKNIAVSVQAAFSNASQVGHVNIVYQITEKGDE